MMLGLDQSTTNIFIAVCLSVIAGVMLFTWLLGRPWVRRP
jgi:hypothetical protein